ncbi:unnamed protein product [Caenorhabditis angaria]|uniref:Uncharacterized protein n=1 Tax=Caenorhabditis angaria TaxID=860376 RepID=A0A9P1N0Z5_9PELO|nr:unnamed protein product [Caenorhabditis angaria]
MEAAEGAALAAICYAQRGRKNQPVAEVSEMKRRRIWNEDATNRSRFWKMMCQLNRQQLRYWTIQHLGNFNFVYCLFFQ